MIQRFSREHVNLSQNGNKQIVANRLIVVYTQLKLFVSCF